MTKTITISDGVDEVLTSIAAKESIPKGEIVEKVVESLKKESEGKRKKLDELFERLTEKEEKGGSEMELLDKLAMYKMFMKEGNTPPQQTMQATSNTNPMTEMMQMMMAMTMMKSLTQPDPLQQMQLMQAIQDGKQDEVQKIQAEMKKEQEKQMDRIEKLLGEKKTSDEIANLRKLFLEKTADKRYEDLKAIITEKQKKTENGKPLYEQIKEAANALNEIKNFAKTIGMTEKEMTTPEGKIDWGAIADRSFDTINNFIEKMPAQRPAQEKVEGVPISGDITGGGAVLEHEEGEKPLNLGVQYGEGGEVILPGVQDDLGGESTNSENLEGKPLSNILSTPTTQTEGEQSGVDGQEATPGTNISIDAGSTAPPGHAERNNICPECGFEAKSQSGLLTHMKAKHPSAARLVKEVRPIN